MGFFPLFRNLPLGARARGTINKEKTYRVRRGNGNYASTKGREYQDIMDYYVTADPKTPAQQANRGIFADAVAGALLLTEEQREAYREKARKKGGQSWISVFISEYMLENA